MAVRGRALALVLVALVLTALITTLVACQRRDAAGERRRPITAERFPNLVEKERTELVVQRLGMHVREPEPIAQPQHVGECEPHQRKFCGGRPIYKGPMVMGDDGEMHQTGTPLMYTCVRLDDGAWHWDDSQCNTPLVVAFGGDEHVTFTQPASNAASFNLGSSDRTEWVSARTPWLALDADGSGCIEGQGELFGPPEDGTGTNGFQKLARLDENHDGRIDEADPAFPSLLLWADANQDKRCTTREVVRLVDAGIVALELDYATNANAPVGSHEGEHATLWFRASPGDPLRKGRLIDVYLATPRATP